MPEHAPEPWTFSRTYEALLDAEGRLITVIANEDTRFPSCGDGRGEFRRIVACVNALRNFPTETVGQMAEGGTLQIAILAAPDPFAPEIVEATHPGDSFVDLCRKAYRAIYSQQKHLDPDNDGQFGHGQDALNYLRKAFKQAGVGL